MNDEYIRKITEGYKNGYSDVEVCESLGVTLKQYNSLYDSSDAFAQLVDYGRTVAHAWWMSKARSNLNERSFNTSLYIMVMKNRYGWADKIESSALDGSDQQSAKELKNRLEKELPKLLKQLRPELAEAELLGLTGVALNETS